MAERVLFIGGDRRMLYAADALSERFAVDRLAMGDFPAPSGRYAVVVLPLPLSRGDGVFAPLSRKPVGFETAAEFAEDNALVFSGGVSMALREICDSKGLRFADYFADESLTLYNAALTAEGAVTMLSQSTDGSLLGSRAVITGFGRVAEQTARLLKAHGALVTVCARSPEARMKASLEGFIVADMRELPHAVRGAEFVINTVPVRVFGEECFGGMRGAVFMELASLPAEGECSPKPHCDANGVAYIHAGGLPGKCSPKSAGEAIAKTVLRLYEALSANE